MPTSVAWGELSSHLVLLHVLRHRDCVDRNICLIELLLPILWLCSPNVRTSAEHYLCSCEPCPAAHARPAPARLEGVRPRPWAGQSQLPPFFEPYTWCESWGPACTTHGQDFTIFVLQTADTLRRDRQGCRRRCGELEGWDSEGSLG